MKKRKILYVITKSNMGGAQRYVYDLATSLPRESYEVSVATGGHGLLKTRLAAADIATYDIQSFERDINLVKELRSAYELFVLMRKLRPDIVHLNSSKAGGIGAFAARLAGVPCIIFTAHGWPFYEPRVPLVRGIIWFFSYLTTLLSHVVIVVSEHDKRRAWMLGLKKKIVKIHTALPEIVFEDKNIAREALFPFPIIESHRDDLWLVSTGELTRNKNLTVLIKAIASLTGSERKKFFLTIVGDGELREELKTLVTENHLADRVHFTGFVPEVRVFLKAFDVFLMPSLKEGFPYGLLEAGAAKLACIASAVGGIPEIIENGASGILIDPKDATSVSRALLRFAEDAGLRDAYGHLLSQHVRERYALSRMCVETMNVYESNGSVTA